MCAKKTHPNAQYVNRKSIIINHQLIGSIFFAILCHKTETSGIKQYMYFKVSQSVTWTRLDD